MKYDFWNNPLVVSAMRLKYRRGSPGMTAAIWVLLLLGVGALLNHIGSQTADFRFATAYLIAILSVQFLISGIVAVSSTSSSMNAEVVNRTLDFQRIVSLSPRSILLGKMIGEPALSYFTALATVPLVVLCWGFGAASGPVVFWLYVNLATFTLMWSAFGLINSLSPPAQGATRSRSGGGAWAFAALFFILPQMIVRGSGMREAPVIGEVLNLLTPVGSLTHLWQDSAWESRLTFWGLSVPTLIIGPIAQLGLAWWIVAAMARRLKNPNDPAVTKPRSYAAIFVMDLLIASICYAKWKQGFLSTHVLYGYGLAHIAVCAVMMFSVVPPRGALLSWLWRRDPRASRPVQLLWGNRSDMSLAAVVYGVIGLVVLAIGLLAPMSLTDQPGQWTTTNQQLAELCVVTFVVVVSAGVTHQFFAATAARGGHLLFVLLMVMANILPPVTAAVLQASERNVPESTIETITSASPVALYVMNMSKIASPNASAGWVIGIYALLGIFSYAMLRRLMKRDAATIQRKLQTMGVAA